MRAVVHDRYGGPEVLHVAEVDPPSIGDDGILIRVEAAEACKSDAEMRAARWSVKWFTVPMRLYLGWRRPRRPILGLYFAGTIEELGDDVEGFTVGEAVYGSPGLHRGAYGEFLALGAKAVIAPKPSSLTFAEAAAVPLGAINGDHFVARTEVGDGDRVLVNGAGGVIGAFAVQAAANRGATVTGVDAAHKEAFVRSAGATEFVDYQRTDVAGLGARFDVIIDMVPSTSVRAMRRLLVPGGRYANGNPRLSTLLAAPLLTRFTDRPVHVAFAAESRTVLRDLAERFDRDELRPIVDRVLPMTEAAEAHRLVETEERVGAIVLAIGEHADSR